MHYNATQLTATRPGTEGRRSSSPSLLLRGKVGQEREAIGRDFMARQQAGMNTATGLGNPSTSPSSVINPMGGSPGFAAAAEVTDLASLRRGAFDLTQPKIREENDLEISSEPQVLRGERVPPPDRRRRPSLYSPTAKLEYMT